MTGPGSRRFDRAELGSGAPAELHDALTAAEWLEAAMVDAPVQPSADFTGRVMAALADEPAPVPAGFLVPLRRSGILAGFAASVRQAWTSAAGGGRPLAVRAAALAYVLAVAVGGSALAGAATVGVGSVLGIIGPSTTATPTHQTPTPVMPRPADATPPSVLPSPRTAPPEPSREPGESDDPESSDDHGGSGSEPSDDHGDDESSGPDSSGSESDDNSGPGSSGSDDSETATPEPTRTPDSGGDD